MKIQTEEKDSKNGTHILLNNKRVLPFTDKLNLNKPPAREPFVRYNCKQFSIYNGT